MTCDIPEIGPEWGGDSLDPNGSASLPLAECSIWVWCPCTVYEALNYCERDESSSCPMDEECCASDGSWYLRCGDPCLGPPCHVGQYYGDVSIICRCPTSREPTDGGPNDGDTVWTVTPDLPQGSCDEADGFPADPPHPWTVPYGKFTSNYQVPDTVFPAADCEDGAYGVWTWCPCASAYGSYPGLQECLRVIGGDDVPNVVKGEYIMLEDNFGFGEAPIFRLDDTAAEWYIWYSTSDNGWWVSGSPGSTGGVAWGPLLDECPIGVYGASAAAIEVLPCCPDAGGGCNENTTGPGEWVFRGGCVDFGPPPVLGRFYGETIMTGYCCGNPLADPEAPVSSMTPPPGSPGICDIPTLPQYWWQLLAADDDDGDDPDRVLNEEGGGCTVAGACIAWIWCQCSDDQSSSCSVSWGSLGEDGAGCPYEPPEVNPEPGYWKNYGDDDVVAPHGAPCIIGRFYGEVVWYCECTHITSSSSSSLSLSSSSPSSLSVSSLPSVSSSSSSSSSSSYYQPKAPYVPPIPNLPDAVRLERLGRLLANPLRAADAAAIIYEKLCGPCPSNVDNRCTVCVEEGCLQGNEPLVRTMVDDFDEEHPLRNKSRLAAEHCPLWKW